MFVTNITYIVCVCLLYPLKIWQMDIYISACRQSVTNLISVLVLWGLRYFICIKIHVYWRKKFSEKEFLKTELSWITINSSWLRIQCTWSILIIIFYCWHFLQSFSFELCTSPDSNSAIHIWRPRLEGVLLVHIAKPVWRDWGKDQLS